MRRHGVFLFCMGLASFVGIIVFTFSLVFIFPGVAAADRVLHDLDVRKPGVERSKEGFLDIAIRLETSANSANDLQTIYIVYIE